MKLTNNIIIATIGILLLTNIAAAANIGVSPANANFPQVLRGGYAERPIRITLDTEQPVRIQATIRGEIADWITLSEDTFTVSRDNPYSLIASIRPPSAAPNGAYEGFIRIQSDSTANNIPGGATGIVIPALDVHVTVQVTDQEVRGCSASNFKVFDVEEGEGIIFTADVLNTGNIWFSPLFTLNIWNQDNTEIVQEVRYSDTSITPTQSEPIRIEFPSDELELGQYWLEATAVDCYEERTLTFDVLEEGSLKASGTLKEILVPVWVEQGETIPIKATFTNDGEKPVRTKFKGQVTRDGKIIQLFESDQEVFVELGEETEYIFYFTAKETGRYLISGRVFYDGKRTYEKSAAFNVRSKNQTLRTIIKSLTYIALIALIAYLLYKIRKERKSYEWRVRRLR